MCSPKCLANVRTRDRATHPPFTHSVSVPDKVTPAASLADPHGVHPALNGHLGRSDKTTKLLILEVVVTEKCASLQEGGGGSVPSVRHTYEGDLFGVSGAILLASAAARTVVLDESDHSCSHVRVFPFPSIVVGVIGVRLGEEGNTQIFGIRRGCHGGIATV